MHRSFTEHGLGGVLPQRTGAAMGGLFAQACEDVVEGAGVMVSFRVCILGLSAFVSKPNAGRPFTVPAIPLGLLIKTEIIKPD
jgi:hypothetical protein